VGKRKARAVKQARIRFVKENGKKIGHFGEKASFVLNRKKSDLIKHHKNLRRVGYGKKGGKAKILCKNSKDRPHPGKKLGKSISHFLRRGPRKGGLVRGEKGLALAKPTPLARKDSETRLQFLTTTLKKEGCWKQGCLPESQTARIHRMKGGGGMVPSRKTSKQVSEKKANTTAVQPPLLGAGAWVMVPSKREKAKQEIVVPRDTTRTKGHLRGKRPKGPPFVGIRMIQHHR